MEVKALEVYFADDHKLVANAIGELLLKVNGIASVKTFSNGKELYEACVSKIPQLVILDIEMPEWNGIETLKKIKALVNVPTIMLTMNDEKAVIEECMKAGANGYLNKNCALEELQEAITSVLAGTLFLSEETKKIMVGLKQTESPAFSITEPLTEKEYEVLKLVCEGLSSKEIGEKLFISSRTVETRKNNLMQKFNVQTTGKLIALAIKNKLVK